MAKTKTDIKLTPAMKKVISQLRGRNRLSYSGIYKTYRMSGKSLNKASVEKLISLGLLERGESYGFLVGTYRLELTETGKTISI